MLCNDDRSSNVPAPVAVNKFHGYVVVAYMLPSFLVKPIELYIEAPIMIFEPVSA